MPILENNKHERFAQALAKGLGITEAYVTAGYGDSPASASRLSKTVKIQKRVAELQKAGAKKTEATVESCTHRLRAAYVLAIQKKNASAAVGAVMAEAKINGLLVNKHQHGGSITLLHITPEKLRELDDDEIAILEAALPLLQNLGIIGRDSGGEGEEEGGGGPA